MGRGARRETQGARSCSWAPTMESLLAAMEQRAGKVAAKGEQGRRRAPREPLLLRQETEGGGVAAMPGGCALERKMSRDALEKFLGALHGRCCSLR